MILIRYTDKVDFEYDIQGLLRSFFPGEETVTDRELEADLIIEASFHAYETEPAVEMELRCISAETTLTGTFISPEASECQNQTEPDYVRKETKNRMKRTLYKLLSEYTGRELAWGTLSGIRPTKITTAFLEQGMSEAECKQRFIEEYYVSEEKAQECVEISLHERELLKPIDYKQGYSIYIGIPFCPSTCLYCSFTSYPLSKYRKKIDRYLDALCMELEYVAKNFQYKTPDTIYIGGGTPTTLEPEQLDRLLGKVASLFDTKSLKEYTVEAGRPDSITKEKLETIRKYDVTRISINPQTMKAETLKIIGRHHTVDDFLHAYQLSRECGFDNINMDFILGLPDESLEDVENSMQWVEKLRPDSLTIHSLALKRAARLNIMKEDYKQYSITNSDEIMEITRQTAKNLGLKPYYLYRQKNMAGNLENIGYAREGKAGIYNILIMEEKQTIMAVGAGSSTKIVHPDGHKITRIENVKDVDLYITGIQDMIERKDSFFRMYPDCLKGCAMW